MPTMTKIIPALLVASLLAGAGPARAGIVLSQVVVDIAPTSDLAQNLEIANDGIDVSYIVVEPAEIVNPGQPAEARNPIVDPGTGGLLVSPQRLILQPGERKAIRIAVIGPRGTSDRVYRVTVKPVAGTIAAPTTALKLLVGYDVLVIYRPASPAAKVVGERNGTTLTLRNDGNTNAEVFEGKQCETATPHTCRDLPPRRLYAGQAWKQPLTGNGPVRYRVAVGTTSSQQLF